MSLITLKEVAAELACSKTTVDRLVAAGAIATVKITDRSVRVARADLQAYIASLPRRATERPEGTRKG